MTATDIANLALLKLNEAAIEDIEDTGDPVARKALLLYEPTLKEVLKAAFWNFALTTASLERSISELTITAENLTVGGVATTLPLLIESGTYNSKPFWSNTGGNLASNPDWYCGFNISGTSNAWEIWQNAYPATMVGTSADYPEDVTSWTNGTGFGSTEITTVRMGASPGWDRSWLLPSDLMKLRKVMAADGTRIDKFDFRRIQNVRCMVSGLYDSVILEYVAFVNDPDAYDPLFLEAFSTLLASKLARSVAGSEKFEAELLQAYHALALPAARTADAQETQSAENHPLKELLAGSLTGTRGAWFDTDLEES